MKIIIAGAGEVGYHLAKILAEEEHDIVLIDKREEALTYAENHLDVTILRGNSISIQLLEEAGIAQTDMLIAATSSEETNITTAIIGKHLGAKQVIARISNPEFQVEKEKLDLERLGIDAMVFPEDLAAKEIFRLIKRASLTDTFEFGDGKLTLTGVVLEDNAPIIHKNLIEAVEIVKGLNFTVVAIQRKEKTIIPRGDTHFLAGDHVYFISHPERLGDIMDLTGKRKIQIRNIMILGGGLIAKLFAQKSQHKYNIKLIESDRDRCFELANDLPQTLVIHGDGSDVDLLEEEGISEMDAFIAVTENSDTNIISCLVAKNHGVTRTIALVENINYISLSQNIGIDTLINKKLITVNNIFRYIREGTVAALTSLHGVDSEILEFIVPANSKITRAPIKNLTDFPRQAVIGGIVRGKKAMIATGDLQIQAEDRVVVFALSSVIHKIEGFFK